jgi:hypothetical protein
MQLSPLPAPDNDAQAPADTWSPERQLAQMLDLCEAQMESALAESDGAVSLLIKTFEALAETMRAARSAAAKLPLESRPDDDFAKQLESMSEQMASAVVAFQFYDKLTQRLGHVRYSLSTLALFVCDPLRSAERSQWGRLFTSLRRLYRTEEERRLFQMMLDGTSADDAKAQIQRTAESRPAPAGDIELF